MANRLIGAEITARTIRVAVLGQHRGVTTVIALEQRPYADAGELPGLLAALVPGGLQLTDRVATALPAGQAYLRELRFPFRERRKVLAAAPFALADQLPVAVEDCQTTLLAQQEAGTGVAVVAAAVRKAALSALLGPFERERVPLHVVDLMPHALAGGLGETIGTGLLLCLNEDEATLTRLDAGRVTVHRHFPLASQQPETPAIVRLLRDSVVCSSRPGSEPLPVLVTGSQATPLLLEQLKGQGLPARPLSLGLGHRDIPAAFVPAAALALRLDRKVADRCFNLRQGAYAYRGEAAALNRTLYLLAALLGASLLLFTLSGALAYRERSRHAEALLQQMTRQYQETFPGSPITVDVALQMESKLQELRNRAAALGIGGQPQPLPILKELSAVAARTPYQVEDLACDQGACTLTGSTDSFEAVNRIRAQLAAAGRFGTIEVAETRRGAAGGLIEFRLRLPLSVPGGRP